MDIWFAIAVAVGLVLFILFDRGSRPSSVLLYAVLVVAVAAGLLRAMGTPRPLEWHLLKLTEAHVIGYQLDEPRTIYLYLAGRPPLSLSMAWRDDVAQDLVDAERNRREGEALVMRWDEGADVPSIDRIPAVPGPRKERG